MGDIFMIRIQVCRVRGPTHALFFLSFVFFSYIDKCLILFFFTFYFIYVTLCVRSIVYLFFSLHLVIYVYRKQNYVKGGNLKFKKKKTSRASERASAHATRGDTSLSLPSRPFPSHSHCLNS